ncbi:MAG: protein-disulfide reductase DsbD domain-containing protein [Devosia sp.]
MLKLATFCLVTLAATPALAAATDWQELAPGARARLITSDTIRNGRMLVGLELDMPQTTNTYWRIPGETGIPTQLDFSKSIGVTDPLPRWPFPEIDTSNGYLDYVYRGPVVLPVSVQAVTGGELQLTATLGICDTVCVPASATFSLALDIAKPDKANSIRLDQAVALSPIPWDQPGTPFREIRTDVTGKVLVIDNPDRSIDPATIIPDIGNPAVLFEAPQKSPDTAIWNLPLLAGADGQNLLGESIDLTFMTASGAYSFSTTVGRPKP